jgi:thiol-disulfide isomerase/thioredoxin
MELTDKDDVRKTMKSTEPVAIFFYMDGCPHCDRMKKPWSDLESKHKDVKLVKVESKNVPEESGISGFPHFELVKDGKKVKSVDGEMDGGELEKQLFGGKSGGRRRRTRSRKTRRRTVRKSRK